MCYTRLKLIWAVKYSTEYVTTYLLQYTVHVTLTRQHSCKMGVFKLVQVLWAKLTRILTGITDSELNLKQKYVSQFFEFTAVEEFPIWVVREFIWTWVVKKKEKEKRTLANRRENRKKTVKIRHNEPEN